MSDKTPRKSAINRTPSADGHARARNNEPRSLPRRVLVNANGKRSKDSPVRSASTIAIPTVKFPLLCTFKVQAPAEPSAQNSPQPRRGNEDEIGKEGETPVTKQLGSARRILPTIILNTSSSTSATPVKALFGATSKCETPSSKQLDRERDEGADVPPAATPCCTASKPLSRPNNGNASISTEKGKVPSFFSRVPFRLLQGQNVSVTSSPSGEHQHGPPLTLARRLAIAEVCSPARRVAVLKDENQEGSNRAKRLAIAEVCSPARRVAVLKDEHQEGSNKARRLPSYATVRRCSSIASDIRHPSESDNLNQVRRKLEGLLTDVQTPKR